MSKYETPPGWSLPDDLAMKVNETLKKKSITPEEALQDAFDVMARDIALIEPNPVDWGRTIRSLSLSILTSTCISSGKLKNRPISRTAISISKKGQGGSNLTRAHIPAIVTFIILSLMQPSLRHAEINGYSGGSLKNFLYQGSRSHLISFCSSSMCSSFACMVSFFAAITGLKNCS